MQVPVGLFCWTLYQNCVSEFPDGSLATGSGDSDAVQSPSPPPSPHSSEPSTTALTSRRGTRPQTKKGTGNVL